MSRTRLKLKWRGTSTAAPQIQQLPTIVSENPGNYESGMTLHAVPPVYTPVGATLQSLDWTYGDETPIGGETGSTYTPDDDDIGETIRKIYSVTSAGQTVFTISDPVGPIIAATPTGAPIVANQTILFGRSTRSGAGAAAPVNTGGAYASGCTIDSGNGAGHWQMNAANGQITPTAAGQGNLLASYTLGCTFGNPSGSDTATITITTEAGAYDVAGTDPSLAAAQMVAATAASGGVTGGGKIYLRPGITFNFAPTWFNDKGWSSLVTVESRDPDNPGIFDTGARQEAHGWHNIKFKYVKWTPRFQRRAYGNTQGFMAAAGTCGTVIFEDCEIYGNMTQLGAPGTHYHGFWYVKSNDSNTTAADWTFRRVKCHGMSQFLRITNGKDVGSLPGTLLVEDCDCWDILVDVVQVSTAWNNAIFKNNYFHTFYMNRMKPNFAGDTSSPTGQSASYYRTGNWIGATDSKKFLFTASIQFRYYTPTSVSDRVIYAHGTLGTQTFKIYRQQTTMKIGCRVYDTSGVLVADLLSAQSYGTSTTGTPKLVILVSGDTDRNIQMRIWKEADTGGGSWDTSSGSEFVTSSALAGQTLDLANGDAMIAGLPSPGTTPRPVVQNDQFHVTRIGFWFGAAPDLTDSANYGLFVNDANGIDGAYGDIFTAFGTPACFLEGTKDDWNNFTTNTLNSKGTGGGLTGMVGKSLDYDHTDFLQGLFAATINNFRITTCIFWAGVDTSAQYQTRPWDPDFDYIDPIVQGPFMEDMNSDHYNVDGIFVGNIVATQNAWGVAPFNAQNCVVGGNTCVMPLPFDGAADVTLYPQVVLKPHGSAPLTGGNVVTENLCDNVSITIAGTNLEANNIEAARQTNYATYMNWGAEPTTRAELIDRVTPLVGGTMLTAVPKIGAVNTYFNHTTGDVDYPRVNTCDAFSGTEGTATQITNITKLYGGASSSGAVIRATGGSSVEWRITSDAGGSTVVRDWTSSAAIIQSNQYLWVRGATAATVTVYVGRTSGSWTTTA